MFNPNNIENEFFLKLGFNFDPEQIAKGKLLLSEPFLRDPNFMRSVVLVAEYEKEEGTFGFILNKPTDLDMNDVVEDFASDSFGFNYGGPVSPENLFFVHTLGEAIPESKPIMDGLWWGGDFDVIRSMIATGQLTKDQIRFFGGYSGWEEGQLERELSEHSWIIADCSPEDVFHVDQTELWKDRLKSLGNKFSIMAGFPEDPAMN